MADNVFRGFHRDTPARTADSAPRSGGVADPLAELARLIGQSDHGRGYAPQAFDDAAPAAEIDWSAADEDYPEQSRSYFRPDVPPFDKFGGPEPGYAGEAYDDHYDEERSAATRRPSLPLTTSARNDYQADDPAEDEAHAPSGEQHYAGGEYEQVAPRRRGAVAIIAALGLVVLGTAGALGYRAMFGGSMIPSLPPIIKPSAKPVKIVPSHEAQTHAPGQGDSTGTGSTERLVSHEEQPVDVQAQSANPVPHVVATIPVISNTGDGEIGNGTVPGAAAPPTASGGIEVASPVEGSGQMATPGLPSSGAKKVHTVLIRENQREAGSSAAVPPAASPSTRGTPMPDSRPGEARRTRELPRRERERVSGGPLSIVPTDEATQSVRPRTRTAMTRRTGPMSLTTSSMAAPAAAGGFAVQVSSRRSEAEAQAAFRSLQARFPQQLGGRRAMVRRVNLGVKGVYYRVLVGPFGSGADAASLCSSLKAAGGSCIVQRI
jgi:hypothetical protein